MKVALYCRSSINSQENSIDMQQTIAYAVAAQHSLLFDETYIDSAVSARNNNIENRPDLFRLLNEIKRGDVKTLFVYKRDRLARNVKQHLEIYEMLKEHNVNVIFTASNELPLQYSPAGEFFELVIAGFNEREANQIAIRVKDTKLSLFSEGKNHGSIPPYGYYSDEEKKIQPDVEKLEIVQRIFDELLVTECETFSDFVRYLERNKIINEKKSNYNRVKKYIQTTEYMGIRKAKFFEEIIEIEQKRLRIIDEEKWNQAQNILKSLIRSRGPRNSDVAMLDGLVICARCGKPAKRKPIQFDGKNTVMYVCPDHRRNKVSQKALEEFALKEVTKWVENMFHSNEGTMFKELLRRIEAECRTEISQIEQQIKAFKEKIILLTKRWMLDKDSTTQEEMMIEYSKLSELENKKKLLIDAQTAINLYPERIQAVWKKLNVREKFDNMDTNLKSFYLRDVISCIVIETDFMIEIKLRNPIAERLEAKEGEMRIALNVVD